jgi:NAD(P)-dependent dehydrogenase (short-subunit alcohol dehydrogenase family)
MSKTILITGTSSGFGRDTAQTLAEGGHRVFATMRDIAARNHANAQHLRDRGISVVEFDVTNDASVERGVQAVLQQAGHIDVVINNAGIGALQVSEAFTADQLRELFEVNVFGVHRMLRATLPTLRAQRDGLVINIGSVVGRVTLPFFGLYGSSKFALEAISDSYRYELSRLGIDVVLVQPGRYPTGIYGGALSPADTARIPAYGDLGRIPDRMAQATLEAFKRDDAPNPHEVAEAIRSLIEQPRGTRPARVVVGRSLGADVLNHSAGQVQEQILEELGLSFLAPHGEPAAS